MEPETLSPGRFRFSFYLSLAGFDFDEHVVIDPESAHAADEIPEPSPVS